MGYARRRPASDGTVAIDMDAATTTTTTTATAPATSDDEGSDAVFALSLSGQDSSSNAAAPVPRLPSPQASRFAFGDYAARKAQGDNDSDETDGDDDDSNCRAGGGGSSSGRSASNGSNSASSASGASHELDTLSTELFDRVIADAALRPFFEKAAPRRVVTMFADFFVAILGDSTSRSGVAGSTSTSDTETRHCRSVAQAHRSIGVTDEHFDRFAGHVQAACHAAGLADAATASAAAVVEAFRQEIVRGRLLAHTVFIRAGGCTTASALAKAAYPALLADPLVAPLFALPAGPEADGEAAPASLAHRRCTLFAATLGGTTSFDAVAGAHRERFRRCGGLTKAAYARVAAHVAAALADNDLLPEGGAHADEVAGCTAAVYRQHLETAEGGGEDEERSLPGQVQAAAADLLLAKVVDDPRLTPFFDASPLALARAACFISAAFGECEGDAAALLLGAAGSGVPLREEHFYAVHAHACEALHELGVPRPIREGASRRSLALRDAVLHRGDPGVPPSLYERLGGFAAADAAGRLLLARVRCASGSGDPTATALFDAVDGEGGGGKANNDAAATAAAAGFVAYVWTGSGAVTRTLEDVVPGLARLSVAGFDAVVDQLAAVMLEMGLSAALVKEAAAVARSLGGCVLRCHRRAADPLSASSASASLLSASSSRGGAPPRSPSTLHTRLGGSGAVSALGAALLRRARQHPALAERACRVSEAEAAAALAAVCDGRLPPGQREAADRVLAMARRSVGSKRRLLLVDREALREAVRQAVAERTVDDAVVGSPLVMTAAAAMAREPVSEEDAAELQRRLESLCDEIFHDALGADQEGGFAEGEVWVSAYEAVGGEQGVTAVVRCMAPQAQVAPSFQELLATESGRRWFDERLAQFLTRALLLGEGGGRAAAAEAAEAAALLPLNTTQASCLLVILEASLAKCGTPPDAASQALDAVSRVCAAQNWDSAGRAAGDRGGRIGGGRGAGGAGAGGSDWEKQEQGQGGALLLLSVGCCDGGGRTAGAVGVLRPLALVVVVASLALLVAFVWT